MKKFVIVGLGLIGGSMALALRGFEDYTIVGVDVSQPTLRFARERGVCDRVTEDAGEAIEGADVVMLAIHPQGILDFLKAYRDRFKPGCLVTDVCGVKSAIMEGAECLPEGVDFTARFVRGDSSRTDGGSGLGLSIASSFTEACGGAFRVETVADLFTAVVTFPTEQEGQEA